MISILIDVALVLIVSLMAYMGYKKGLVRTLYSIFALVLSVVITACVYKPVTDAIMNLDFAKTSVKSINATLTEKIVESTPTENMPMWLENYIEGEIKENTVLIAEKIMEVFVMVVTAILVFILVKILLGFAVGIVDALMRLPILDTANKAGGMLCGVLKAVIVSLFIFGVASVIIVSYGNNDVHEIIMNTYISKYFYDSNLLMSLILK